MKKELEIKFKKHFDDTLLKEQNTEQANMKN